MKLLDGNYIHELEVARFAGGHDDETRQRKDRGDYLGPEGR